MSTTSTIVTVTLLAATAIGVAYYTNPQLFGTASAVPKTAPASAAAPAGGTAKPSPVVVAQATPDTRPPATPAAVPADAKKSPAEAIVPAAWIGLPVISADGTTIGQVTEVRPHADGRSVVLVIKGSDGKMYDVSSALATMQGRAVQVAATAAEIGKMVR